MREGGENLYMRGISYKCASPEQIGACSVPREILSEMESEILASGSVSEILALLTCNRVEFYFVSQSADSFASVASVLSARNADMGLFEKISYSRNGAGAISHIFEVASGLSSQMVGETEILGQVKAAYARAAEAGHCGRILNPVLQKAAQCAKLIRTDTEIGRGKISVGSVSAELAIRIFGDLKKASILLIGSGDVGRLVADALSVRGASNICVSSRTFENAKLLAEKIGARAMEMSEVPSRLKEFDVIVCASAAKKTVISADTARRTAAARCGKPLFLIDLAVPSNVEAKAAEIDDVFLYNLSDLSRIAAENLRLRREEIVRASAIAEERAKSLAEKLRII